MPIEITKTERGFHNYGEPIIDSYQNEITVRESSAASGPRVWVFCKPGLPWAESQRGEASLHLTPDQARGLVERLQAWLDEIPGRWGGEGVVELLEMPKKHKVCLEMKDKSICEVSGCKSPATTRLDVSWPGTTEWSRQHDLCGKHLSDCLGGFRPDLYFLPEPLPKNSP